jgi:hypothetical protein
VDYQAISDLAQFQMLQELLRMVLYGILLSAGMASVCLLGLCLSELRLPRRRPSVGKGREWRRAAGPPGHERVADARGGSFVIPHSPPAGGIALTGGTAEIGHCLLMQDPATCSSIEKCASSGQS